MQSGVFAICVILQLLLFKGSQSHVHKRSPSFIRGGAIGYLVAIAVPIELPPRNVFLSFNFEANYNLPYNETHQEFIEKWDLDGIRDNLSNNVTYMNMRSSRNLYSRQNFYKILENYLEQLGFNGEECVLRIICEVSASQLGNHNGLLGSIVDVLFLPTASKREDESGNYYQAETDGLKNYCNKYFGRCPQNILDYVSSYGQQ